MPLRRWLECSLPENGASQESLPATSGALSNLPVSLRNLHIDLKRPQYLLTCLGGAPLHLLRAGAHSRRHRVPAARLRKGDAACSAARRRRRFRTYKGVIAQSLGFCFGSIVACSDRDVSRGLRASFGFLPPAPSRTHGPCSHGSQSFQRPSAATSTRTVRQWSYRVSGLSEAQPTSRYQRRCFALHCLGCTHSGKRSRMRSAIARPRVACLRTDDRAPGCALISSRSMGFTGGRHRYRTQRLPVDCGQACRRRCAGPADQGRPESLRDWG